MSYWDSSLAFRVTPESIDTQQMTHIHYAFGVIEAGTLAIVPQGGASEWPMIKRFITAVTTRSSCVKPIITLGGWVWAQGQGGMAIWQSAISTEATRAQFAAQVVAFCRTHGFAGVDLVRDESEPWSCCGDGFCSQLIISLLCRRHTDGTVHVMCGIRHSHD